MHALIQNLVPPDQHICKATSKHASYHATLYILFDIKVELLKSLAARQVYMMLASLEPKKLAEISVVPIQLSLKAMSVPTR